MPNNSVSSRDYNNDEVAFGFVLGADALNYALVVLGTGSEGGTVAPVTSANPVFTKAARLVSAGTGQFNLAVPNSGAPLVLTVPPGTLCAQITIEGGSVRRTSDGTTAASATVGTLIQQGASWQDWGPLAAYQFFAAAGSPTLDVEYFM